MVRGLLQCMTDRNIGNHYSTDTHFFQDYLDILERHCPKQTIHYETSTAVLVAMSFAMS